MYKLDKTIGFLGIGNMGGAVLQRLVLSLSPSERTKVYIYGKTRERRERLAAELGVNFCNSSKELAEKSRIIFLGVKPNVLMNVLEETEGISFKGKILVSMAAGISLRAIEDKIRGFKNSSFPSSIIRIMPNTPVLLGQGATALCSSGNEEDEDCRQIEDILSCTGEVVYVNEDLFHSVIGASGSSPAYTYMYIEALIEAACESGLEKSKAVKLVAQTVMGSAAMILASAEEPATLVDRVCSKGGTTIEAVNLLEKEGFKELVKEGFRAAMEKSIKMTEGV